MKPATCLTASALALMGGLAVTACAERPASTASIDQAANAYNQAAGDHQATSAAPGEIDASRETLAKAREIWRDSGDRPLTDHYAYLATQHAQTARAEGRERAADAQVAALTPGIHDTARVATLSDVLFGHDRANLNTEGRQSVADLARFLNEHPNRSVRITGYTDSQGSAQHNQALSERRAESVKQALVENGVDAQRITTSGMGEESPIASNNTNAGRQQNRRVEVAIEGTPGAPGMAPTSYGATR